MTVTTRQNAELVCERCGSVVVGGICTVCATAVEQDERREDHRLESVSLGEALSDLQGLVHKRWVVLAVLFGVTGALGLPLLWVSRGFRLPGKLAWSILVTLYTGFLFWMAWTVCQNTWEQFREFYHG